VQARSTASVDAILKATVQVLLRVGKERLTTTRVAERAGVSVGTLYQYFPNKRALLQAALKQHFEEITQVLECTCRQQEGKTLRQMATAVVTAFLDAKMKDARTSAALYSVSSDVDGTKLVQQMIVRHKQALVRMLATAPEPLAGDLQQIASMLQATVGGVIRTILESGAPEKLPDGMREELILVACSYLEARSARSSVHSSVVK
jgi:AcrR family transcriptional regulator